MTYGPSVHVKTWLNPQLLTSFSSSARLLPMLASHALAAENQDALWMTSMADKILPRKWYAPPEDLDLADAISGLSLHRFLRL